MLVPQRAPAPSQSLTVEWLGITQLALVAQQIRQVVDGAQRVRVLIPQRAPAPSQSLTEEWLGITQLSLVP